MKLLAVFLALALAGCAQGQFKATTKAAAVDVSTLRATDITIDECRDEGARVQIQPKQFITPGQLGDFIASGAAIMCGLPAP